MKRFLLCNIVARVRTKLHASIKNLTTCQGFHLELKR